MTSANRKEKFMPRPEFPVEKIAGKSVARPDPRRDA